MCSLFAIAPHLPILVYRVQEDILEDLRGDIPLEYNFLFSATHAEVISGKQEGVYAWIGVNYALHKLDHIRTGDGEYRYQIQTCWYLPGICPN